ncbi:glutathione peroxidase [Chitinivibrio alkaliphilus]|uniref:Glutathione peroxidase n=1 Tax=Chitinivibrio alkaliphilus ACht1 TaxID=1313304 RepID=U7D725_9BACT|nr:glutathione peroxidase [Chitinivibrio alkaliphilus]ERP30877.1 glutathione peroxidase [Chitinivibrio alkaliphilus ACht1]
MNTGFYGYTAITIYGEEVSMQTYRKQFVLVVNTASECGYTPQYAGLQTLYEKHSDSLTVLGFPCNQFGEEEPGDAESIRSGCLTTYGVTFPVFQKICVNGKNTHPLYQYLKKKCPGSNGNAIEGNFTKFLIDPMGCPMKRFSSSVTPEEIHQYLKKQGGL